MNVLVIDDDREFASDVAAMLRHMGHSAQTAGSGRGILEDLEDGDYGLVITDVVMPEVDGLEIIRTLQKLEKRPLIMAMSGGSVVITADLGLKFSTAFGADKVLYKPFTLRELQDAVTELLQSSRPAGDT